MTLVATIEMQAPMVKLSTKDMKNRKVPRAAQPVGGVQPTYLVCQQESLAERHVLETHRREHVCPWPKQCVTNPEHRLIS